MMMMNNEVNKVDNVNKVDEVNDSSFVDDSSFGADDVVGTPPNNDDKSDNMDGAIPADDNQKDSSNEEKEVDGDDKDAKEVEEKAKAKRGRPPKQKWTDETDIVYSDHIHKDYHAPEELKLQFIEFAKENGYTPAQATDLLNLQAKMMQEQDEQLSKLEEQELQNTEKALKQDWGAEYENRMVRINKMLEDRADSEIADLFTKTSFGSNEKVLRLLDSFASDLAEDSSFVSGKAIRNVPGFSSAYEEYMNECSMDPNFKAAMTNPNHPLRSLYQKKWDEIHEKYSS